MKRLIAICLVALMPAVCVARGTQDDSLGDKIKRLFTGPSPAPKKKRKRSTTKKSPTPTPTPTPGVTPSPTVAEQTASVAPSASPTVSPSASATASTSPNESPAAPTRSRAHAPLIEPVRAITPRPGSRKVRVETPPLTVPVVSPVPAEQRPTPMNIAPSSSPQQSPPPPPPRATAQPTTPPPPPVATATPKRDAKAPVSIPPSEILGYESYSPNVRRVLDLSLELTTRNLGYKYGSADPKNGGMDCSGFIYYVLKQNGVKDPPRDARDQYTWVRKAGAFQAVLAHSDDSFELEALRPGDLLFWASATHIDRDPAITHTMIYLGREKGTNQRIMVGSNDGRTYKGQQKFGVSVFDFKVGPAKTKSSDDRAVPIFVGYGRIPELPNE